MNENMSEYKKPLKGKRDIFELRGRGPKISKTASARSISTGRLDSSRRGDEISHLVDFDVQLDVFFWERVSYLAEFDRVSRDSEAVRLAE